MNKPDLTNDDIFSLFDMLPDIVILVDDRRRIIWANQRITLLGYFQASLTDVSLSALIADDVPFSNGHQQVQVIPGKDTSARFLAAPSDTSARTTYQLTRIRVKVEAGDRLMLVLSEVSSHADLTARLNHVEMLLSESQSIAKMGSWDWNIENGSLSWSEQIYTMFGLAPDEFAASYDAFLQMIHPDDRALVENAVASALDHGKTYQVNHRIIRPDGEIRYVTERGRLYYNAQGNAVRMIGTILDITDDYHKQQALAEANAKIEAHQVQLRQLAYHDGLTGLPNRNFFISHVDELIATSVSVAASFAIMYIDLDGFKEINDSQGHAAGDLVLKEVASKLRHLLPQDAVLARLGGDEFGVLLGGLTDEALQEKAEHLVAGLPFHKSYGELTLKVTASIGIALFPRDGKTVSELIQKADIAMYRSKASGKNRYQFFEPSMSRAQVERIKLISDLEHALENEEFDVYFQPQVPVIGSDKLYAEALIRWHHPTRGYISPADFIPLAEETGLIIDIGELVFRDVCTLIHTCKHILKQDICVAVNLSVVQLYYDQLLTKFNDIMEAHEVRPQDIEFEVTESALMKDVDAARQVLRSFQENGSSVALDDFGTGYSSLSYLANLPIDTIKVDREFVKVITADNPHSPICKAVISLAHSLHKKVIAEGVETTEQMTFLSDNRCDMLQGFLLSRPLPAVALFDLIESQTWPTTASTHASVFEASDGAP
ncbi:putative bifunctional diguanylate cyclase/phosphodiesterase [Alteromonas sp. CYL-A6]|uniref:putative bifunctional diguanylate cyclase/phosphodiesterase n=1 Tax=Alteromonas nitratireducens TaxID=3390813 RepID=UPI0034BF439D